MGVSPVARRAQYNGLGDLHTFARAFLQFRQAFLVTVCGALLRLTEKARPVSASIPFCRRYELDTAISGPN